MKTILTILSLAALVSCGNTTPENPETSTNSKQPPPTVPQNVSSSEKPLKPAPGPFIYPFSEKFGGMIYQISKTPGKRTPSGTTLVRKVYTLRTQKEFKAFEARIPKNFISKGPARPNTDPILNSPSPDFSRNMLIVVEYDYMWEKPVVVKITNTHHKLLVKARFTEKPTIMQHANGVASYGAVSVLQSSLPVELVR
ncbi:hypothetical protein KKF84_18870 [Myxococcota bacterium]|nr:hypothetical protein [Myxococcota bacterium]MBU1537386.1 hypothetical protein [Myxococcota bacterium]